MSVLFNPVSGPRRIEYVRHAYEPANYHPAETELIYATKAGGRLWSHLGLDEIGMRELRLLADNRNPKTGQNLTARRHARSERQCRTSFLSVVFNVSKSVSLMSELSQDYRIRDLVDDLAQTTLDESEDLHAGFRVRKAGAADRNQHRHTGVMGWVTRRENESRRGDPNLHIHAEVFNGTHDASDPRRPFKALDLRPFLKVQKEVSRQFDRQLELGLNALGYTTAPGRHGSFEIEGVPPPLIERFSKGRRAIESALAEHLVLSSRNESPATIWKAKRRVVRQCRPKKVLLTQAQLRTLWLRQITANELLSLMDLRRLAEAQTTGIRMAPATSGVNISASLGNEPKAEPVMTFTDVAEPEILP